MELDDLKQNWQKLDRLLTQQNALQFEAFKEQRVGKIRRHLLLLQFGQVVQMLFGIAIVLIAVGFWRSYWQETSMLVTGIVMHVYGVMVIACAGVVQGRVSRIDRSKPVLEVQKRLAALRRSYVVLGMWVGLPWAFLWVLCAVMLARAFAGINLYASAPMFVCFNLLLGAAILLGVRGWHRWLAAPQRAELAKRYQNSLSGGSIRKAQAALDEVARFEAE